MSRAAGLLVWTLWSWMLCPLWIAAAYGQLERLPAPYAPAQRPGTDDALMLDPLLGDPDGQAVPWQSLDAQAAPDDRQWAGPSPGQTLPATPPSYGNWYQWQFLPEGLLYKSYLAGGREPRFDSRWVYIEQYGWVWDVALGGRVGLLRFGTDDDTHPEGGQFDLEGAVFPRLDLGDNYDRELMAADFRVGVPWTVRQGPWEAKLAYYHLSSHLGDEYMVAHPSATRINYVRDCIVLGVALRPHPDLRLYSEVGWAFHTDGGAEPWEFQFGIDFSPAGPSGACGAPFLAINGHIREEVDFGGGLTVQAGWQWASRTGHLFRTGVHYFNGMSDQRQFFAEHEELIGLGMWYDF